MLGLNQIKKVIYLTIFLVSLSFSNFALGNVEVAGHFGMKFGSQLNLREITTPSQKDFLGIDQKNMPFHLGLDAIYGNVPVNDKSFGLGLRYRFAFAGERDFDGTSAENTRGGVREDEDDTYKFTHHRVALLANYRFHFDQFFVGAVLGIDIWKHLKFSATGLGPGTNANSYELTSNQFLWNQISGQLGLEAGYKITENLLAKLEVGYDLSRFSNLKCKIARGTNTALTDCLEQGGGNNPLEMEGDESKNTFKLDAFYFTLGIGWFFG